MIPNVDDDLMEDVEVEEQPTLTYEWQLKKDRMGDKVEGLEAMRQAIYHIINTERYENIIYSWNYGIELKDLFGKPVSYCYSEIKRRITEGLLQDERITKVHSFEFSRTQGDVLVKFIVETDFGALEVERSVTIR